MVKSLDTIALEKGPAWVRAVGNPRRGKSPPEEPRGCEEKAEPWPCSENERGFGLSVWPPNNWLDGTIETDRLETVKLLTVCIVLLKKLQFPALILMI